MTPLEGAELMLGALNQFGHLTQVDAVNRLQMESQEDCVYWNANGNMAIRPEVLKEFNRLTPNAVWLRASRYWRPRQEGDQPGRSQPW
ncbi:DUF6953 family protein [Mesorhizobium sp. ArgA1]